MAAAAFAVAAVAYVAAWRKALDTAARMLWVEKRDAKPTEGYMTVSALFNRAKAYSLYDSFGVPDVMRVIASPPEGRSVWNNRLTVYLQRMSEAKPGKQLRGIVNAYVRDSGKSRVTNFFHGDNHPAWVDYEQDDTWFGGSVEPYKLNQLERFAAMVAAATL